MNEEVEMKSDMMEVAVAEAQAEPTSVPHANPYKVSRIDGLESKRKYAHVSKTFTKIEVEGTKEYQIIPDEGKTLTIGDRAEIIGIGEHARQNMRLARRAGMIGARQQRKLKKATRRLNKLLAEEAQA